MEIDLIRIEPEHRRFRFYRLSVWPDLFGGFSLAREWGRLGSPGTLRLDRYGSAAEAGRALERLACAKERRGYRPAGRMAA
jgi:predicted DNA-binding WGR domain protein